MSTFNKPGEVAARLVASGRNKAACPWKQAAVMGMLAGVFIGFGGWLAVTVATGTAAALGFGVSRMVSGAVFSVGLMLVVITGAELFTGNNLLVIAALKKDITWMRMLRSWLLVWGANFAGALLLAAMIYASGLFASSANQVGAMALKTAIAKIDLSWNAAFFRGILCNWLVCLAVWIAMASASISGKILGIFFPIMAFVAMGFEHSVANMFFIPMGLFLKLRPEVVAAAGAAESIRRLTWNAMLFRNLIPVTLGNIIGGGFFVGCSSFYIFFGSRGEDPSSGGRYKQGSTARAAQAQRATPR
jgi:formate/nitrite transporter